MRLLLSEKNIKYNKELEKSYFLRDELNKKYLVLTGIALPELVIYEDIFNLKKTTINSNNVYFIQNNDTLSKEITNIVYNIFTENNIKFVLEPSNFTRKIKISLTKQDLYLNIKGFIKQMYTLNILITDQKNNIISNFNKDFTDTGRDSTQIYEKIKLNINKYLENNLELLLK